MLYNKKKVTHFSKSLSLITTQEFGFPYQKSNQMQMRIFNRVHKKRKCII